MADVQQATAPSVIRIKRKRDDALPDSLVLTSTSKRRATDHTYIFKKLDQERIPSTPVLRQEYDDNGIPKIRTTPKGEEKRDPHALGRVAPQSPTRKSMKQDAQVPSEPRRFHLARPVSVRAAAKGKSDVATFVERRGRGARDTDGTDAAAVKQADAGLRPIHRMFKRPSGKSRTHSPAVRPRPTSPPRMDASMAEQMDQWSQEASHEEDTRKTEAAVQHSQDADAMDIDNEADYVYDTYYRHMLAEGDIPDKDISFGQLVIDEDQEELWETYLDGEDSDDKEFETDEEDSNAEDYYGADYPEDEVASDDEHDRDIYQYRRNADDLEEFDVNERYDSEHDEDELARSDGEEEFQSKLGAARAWRRDFGKASAARTDLMSD